MNAVALPCCGPGHDAAIDHELLDADEVAREASKPRRGRYWSANHVELRARCRLDGRVLKARAAQDHAVIVEDERGRCFVGAPWQEHYATTRRPSSIEPRLNVGGVSSKARQVR